MAALAAALGGGTALAQSADEPGRVFELGEIVVIGEAPGGQTAGEAPSQDAIGDEEIYRFNRNSLDDALTLVPGVHVDGFGGSRNEKIAFVRGFDLFQVPLSIDGVRVYLPYDNRLDLGRFLTPDLAEVQVQKGYVSVLNGPGGMGGAINLVTRKPAKDFEGDARFGIEMGNTGSVTSFTSAGSIGVLRERFYLQAGAAVRDSDGWYLPDSYRAPAVGNGPPVEDGGLRDHSATVDWRMNLKAGFTPNATDEYSLSFTHQEGEKEAPLDVTQRVRGITPTIGAGQAQRLWTWPTWDYESIYFLSHTALGAKSYVDTKLFYNELSNLLSSFDDATYSTQARTGNPFAFDSYYDEYGYGGSIEVGTELIERNLLKAAVHYRRDAHESRNIDAPGAAGAAFDPTIRQVEDVWSFGLENTFHVTDRLDFVAGLSYDRRSLEKAEDFNGVGVFTYPLTTDDAINWQGALLYDLGAQGRLHASVSSRTRFPTLWERFSTRFSTSQPNPDLQAERATNYEIGWSGSVGGTLDVGASIFYSDVEDVIQAIALTTAPVLWQNQNVGDGEYYGAELKLEWAALESLRLGANYTFLEREVNAPSFPGLKPVGTPRHYAFVYADWQPCEEFTLTPSAELSSSRYSSSRFEDAVFRQDGFALVNLAAEYRLNANVSLLAGARNLFDETYQVQEGYPEAGRSFYMTGRISF
ncbi:TonB-dependent receptor [Zavarzinia compransoris]|uniref:TonB-dependent receptor n=1 Tax=Zavarzinia compransoris TaxID=1264899 RepID=A0A317E347_9PROT|nr:TonB-dependent receptor [Zavarzinia compransoris]PWR21061.1 TonB-dependent receptor [Zavarzinia compransoris]